MKRLFYFLMTAAAGLTLASCVQDLEPVSDPALGGTPVAVSFSLDVRDALTKADPASTEMDSGSGVYRLYAAAFSKEDGSLLSTSCIGGSGYEKTGTVSDGKGSITMILNKKQNYTVVFFAQKDDAYDVNFASGNVATFSFKSGLNANNPNLDAFYAIQEVTGASTSYEVKLKRPFAQINVLVPADNAPSGKTAFRSSMKVKVPTSFNLFTGTAGTELKEIEFAENAISTAAFGKYAQSHKWIGMNYVLVPAGGKVQVLSFNETDFTKAIEPGEVPVKVNGRTNLVGELYGKEAEYTFNIGTDSGFSDETENPISGGDEGGQGGEGGGQSETPQDTEIVMAGGNTYTETAPYAINAASSTAPTKITLTVNGDNFATVNNGAANGEKVTATSGNTQVATVAVVGNDVEITPVADGKAKITVSTPAYTKASYKAQSFDFWIEVSGINPTPTPPTDGSGTASDPYSVSKALTLIAALESGKTADEYVFVKGKIAEVTEINVDYKNATYTISDDGTKSSVLTVFRGKYLGNTDFTSTDQLKADDEVVVYGKLQRYVKEEVETPEIAGGNILYALNDKAQAIPVSISGMSDQSLKPGESYTFAATTDKPNGTVVYSIASGADVVTLSGNKVMVNASAAAGKTAVIKASVAATTGFAAAEAAATITVKDASSQTQEYSVEFTQNSWGGMTGENTKLSGQLNDISIEVSSGTISSQGDQCRIFKNQTITISAASGATIKKIVFTCTAAGDSQYGPGCFDAQDGYTVADKVGTWTGSSASVTFKASSNQVRATSIKVIYDK